MPDRLPESVLDVPAAEPVATPVPQGASWPQANGCPPRLHVPGIWNSLLFALFVAFVGWSFSRLDLSAIELVNGLPAMKTLAASMLPPATDRLQPVAWKVLETLQMALIGCGIGVLLSVPVAFFAAHNHAPNRLLHLMARSLVTFLRTVPDLIWALLFIVWVGLGPFAGVLAVIVETIGFCGRFFADAFEETDRGPAEALTAMGARNSSIFACATLPAALPAMTNSSLFALEKAVRSSVVLGLVGAGGIGVELSTSMEMFHYDQAATIILFVFLMVLGVERVSAWLRRKI